jgi:hypothetical protein
MTGATSGVGKKLPIQEHLSSLLIFSEFMVLRYTASDYPCCIFRLVSTVLCLSEECFMFLWLHSRPLLFYVCQRSASCYCGYILYHYCFMYVSEVVHVVISYMYILDKYCLLLYFQLLQNNNIFRKEILSTKQNIVNHRYAQTCITALNPQYFSTIKIQNIFSVGPILLHVNT